MSNEQQQNKDPIDTIGNQNPKLIPENQTTDIWEDILNVDTYVKHVQIELAPHSDQAVEPDQEFNYKSNLKLRPENIDQQLNKDIAVKQLNFSQHEYVKINEVGLLINEAVQGVVDKMHQHDKITQANKSQIRILETKFRQME